MKHNSLIVTHEYHCIVSNKARIKTEDTRKEQLVTVVAVLNS